MRVFLTGDCHCNIDWTSLVMFCRDNADTLTKDDLIVVLGDFGAFWTSHGKTKEERKVLRFYEKAPCQIAFVEGNHENFPVINSFPIETRWGGTVGVGHTNVYHLKRGQIYTWGKSKVFTFGGGDSLDKEYRIPFLHWWPEEQPSAKEMDFALENLEKHNNSVDYILTHDLPRDILKDIFGSGAGNKSTISKFFDVIWTQTKFYRWFAGHVHRELTLAHGKVFTLYNNVIELDVNNEME